MCSFPSKCCKAAQLSLGLLLHILLRGTPDFCPDVLPLWHHWLHVGICCSSRITRKAVVRVSGSKLPRCTYSGVCHSQVTSVFPVVTVTCGELASMLLLFEFLGARAQFCHQSCLWGCNTESSYLQSPYGTILDGCSIDVSEKHSLGWFFSLSILKNVYLTAWSNLRNLKSRIGAGI